jgi:predicted nucleic acid-binding protein
VVVSDRWLIDKSAFSRLDQSPDFELWLSRINRGLVYVAGVTLLELGWSARSAADWRILVQGAPAVNLLIEYLTPAMEDRAIEVQGLLAERGCHRAPSIPDLLIAATAEIAGVAVLHVDKDFELIADLTDQPVERLRGDF